MRIGRKKPLITLSGPAPYWPMFCVAGTAGCLVPCVIAGGLPEALLSADVPAVLLTWGLASAMARRRK